MRALTLAALAAAVLALGGCSSSDGSGGSDPDAGAAASEAAGVGWSPCDGLSAKRVTQLVGSTVTMETGTADGPRCTFLPATEGEPAYDVSYLFFDGGLDNALTAMGQAGTQLEKVDVPGAESARLAVKTKRSGVLVTGFVQTRGLVQSVNAVDLRPYDEGDLVAATTALMTELAAEAPAPGGD